jgi:hypothetical protein
MSKLLLQALSLLPFFLGMGLITKQFIEKLIPVQFSSSPGLLVLLGIYSAGFITMCWNFFFPAGDIFSYSLYAIGLISLLFLNKEIRRQKTEIFSILFLFLLLSFLGMRIDISSDSSGYHLPGIIWTKTEPLPIGIVNLNNALPFNSLLYSVNAATKLPFLDLAAPFLVNAWLCAGFFSFCFLRLWRPSQKTQITSRFTALVLLSFVPLSVYLRHNLGSPSMEISTMILTVIPLIFILEAQENTEKSNALIATAFLFSLLAIMVRLSTAPIALLPIAFYFYELKRKKEKIDFCFCARIFLFGLLVLSPWLARGIISSGCFAYPAHYTCLRFLPWEGSSIANDVAVSSSAWVRNPGVSSEIVLKDWAWLNVWIPLTWSFGVVKLAGLSLFSALPLLVLNRKRIDKSILLFVTCFFIFCFTFWFFALPDARYGYGFFLSVGAVFLAISAGNWRLEKLIKWVPITLTITLVIKTFVHIKSSEAPSDYSNWPAMAKVDYEYISLPPNGIQIFVPTTTNENCWNKIPCTRRVMPGLSAERINGGRLFFYLKQEKL